MRHHGAPTVLLGRVERVDGLAYRTDLIDLQQQTVGGLQLDSLVNTFRIRDGQIVTHDLWKRKEEV